VAADAFRRQNLESSGDVAVAGARLGQALKTAEAPAAAQSVALDEARRSLNVVAPSSPSSRGGARVRTSPQAESAERLMSYTQQSRFVAGRAFYRNGDEWVDAGVQTLGAARPVEIRFGSEEYFALLRRAPGVAPYLSLGGKVLFALEGTVYKITE
jgi:hypothetical protein